MMMRAKNAFGGPRRLAPWLALLLFGCAQGLANEEGDPAAVFEELEIEEPRLLELALKQRPASSDDEERLADEGAAAAELAQLLRDRLEAVELPTASDAGAQHKPIEDEIVSEVAATLDRSIELAQRLLEQDAGIARADGGERAAPSASTPPTDSR